MVTEEQYFQLDLLYEYYNKKLFDSTLPDCMIVLNRNEKYDVGFFPVKWGEKAVKTSSEIGEIILNPKYFFRNKEKSHMKFVHVMIHVWQFEYGKPSENIHYHNLEYVQKSVEIGIMVLSEGKKREKKTGQKIIQNINPEGKFIKAFEHCKIKIFPFIPIISNVSGGSSQSKTKFICICERNIWGKPDTSVKCNYCGYDYIYEEKNSSCISYDIHEEVMPMLK